MVSESHFGSKAAALDAAVTLHGSAGALHDAAARAIQLVQQTQQAAPLWGDDEAGRRYRANYAQCEQVLEGVQRLTQLLQEMGKVCAHTVDALIESDDRAARTLGG